MKGERNTTGECLFSATSRTGGKTKVLSRRCIEKNVLQDNLLNAIRYTSTTAKGRRKWQPFEKIFGNKSGLIPGKGDYLSFKVQRYSKSPAHYFFQDVALLELIVENQHIIDALRYFQLRRKNEIRKEKLDTRSVFHLKVGGGNFDNSSSLARAGVAGYVERVFDTANDKQSKVMVWR